MWKEVFSFWKFFSWIYKHKSQKIIQGQCLIDLVTYQHQLLAQGSHFTRAKSHKTIYSLFCQHPNCFASYVIIYSTELVNSSVDSVLKIILQSKDYPEKCPDLVFYSIPSSCYSVANALYNWTICTTLSGLLLTNQKDTYTKIQGQKQV